METANEVCACSRGSNEGENVTGKFLVFFERKIDEKKFTSNVEKYSKLNLSSENSIWVDV